MARYPCSVNGHRYREGQQSMYPALLTRDRTDRRMLRLCPQHFDGFVDQLRETCQQVLDQGADDIITSCALCQSNVAGQSGSFFVTVYAKGAEREDWYGTVHEDCLAALREDWLLTTDMP